MRTPIIVGLALVAGCSGLSEPEADLPAVGAYDYHIDMPAGYATREYSGTLHITRVDADDVDAYWQVEGFADEMVGNGSRSGVGDTYYLIADSKSGGIATLVGGSGRRLTCTAGVLTMQGLDYTRSCSLAYRG